MREETLLAHQSKWRGQKMINFGCHSLTYGMLLSWQEEFVLDIWRVKKINKFGFQDGFLGNQKHPLGFASLQYDIDNGMFELNTKSYAKIYCNMDFTLYPFDTQGPIQ